MAVARSADGSRFVAFRNSDAGNRDIYVGRSRPDDPGFAPPVAITQDHWKLDGCPHDGPSMVVAGDRLHLAWMDAHSGKNRVYHATSPTTELDFAPRELARSSTGAQGHPKLAATSAGRLLAVWDESPGDEPPAKAAPHGEHGHARPMTGGGRAIMFASLDGDGFAAPRAIDPKPGAFQLQPSIATGPDGTAFVAWVELDADGKRVVLVRVPARP